MRRIQLMCRRIAAQVMAPPYASGPVRPAPARFPYRHPTLADVDEAERLLKNEEPRW